MLILFVGEPNARAALPRLVANASRRTRRGVGCWVMHTNPTCPALRLGYRVPNSEMCEPAPPFSFRLAAFQGCYLRRTIFTLSGVCPPTPHPPTPSLLTRETHATTTSIAKSASHHPPASAQLQSRALSSPKPSIFSSLREAE